VSTILDALRKLQGDRDGMAPVPRRDLRASVLDGGLPPVRPERRPPEPKLRPLVAALGGGVAVAAGIGMFLLWSGPEVSSFEPSAGVPETPAEFPPLAQIPTPPTPPPPPEPVTRAPEPLVNLAAPPETPPESVEARYAAFQPPPPQQPVEREYAGLNDDAPFQDPPQRKTFVPSSKRARPRMDTASPPDDAHGFTPSTTPPPNYEGPQIVTRAEPNAAPQPVELESADMNRARERLAQSEARATQRARREPREEPRAREAIENEPPARETAQPAAVGGVEFPVLEVQSVLWHPDPQRRSATILLDGQLATDAREGDLVGGVLVDRITPGSVEFRMGQERKRVDMAP
jgi:hypothetical protein